MIWCVQYALFACQVPPTPHGRTIRKRENVLDSSARYLQYTTVRTPVLIGTTRRLHARVKTIK